MQNKEMIDEIRRITKEHPSSFSSIISKKSTKNRHLYDFVMAETAHLDERYTMATRLYCILNSITGFPKCANPDCDNTLEGKNVVSLEKGWCRYCSSNCAAKSDERQEKIERTTLERFGSTCFLASKSGRKTREDWCRERGVENPFQLDWVSKKRCETMVDRYGHEFTQQCPELVEKCKETCRRHFGTDHQWANAAIISKGRDTIKKRFGVENVFLVDSVKEKQRVSLRTRRYKALAANDKVVPMFSLEEFIDCKNPNLAVFKWKCIENGHNHEFESLLDENTMSRYGAPARCWKCHPNISSGFSAKETEVVEFIKKHYNGTVLNRDSMNRRIMPGREIDILLPEKKIGIEFDGIFFHSFTEDSKEAKEKHLLKTDYLESIGWKLIHVNEDEWDDKRSIVESRLLSAIGCPSKRIFARKCRIRELPHSETKRFLEENHLQGNVNSKISLGLDCHGELVAVMTFGKPRFNRKYEYELLRYASLVGTQVIGGAGKLLSYFERKFKPKSLISYADRRWSCGSLYKALGFVHMGNSPQNYTYTKGCTRFSRMQFQKSKLSAILENFDGSKTEKENMFANGYRICYDCGNMVFAKEYVMTENRVAI